MREMWRNLGVLILILSGIFTLLIISRVNAADPSGVSNIVVVDNETKSTSTAGAIINISGGRIATINLTATIQNPRWKGFVGNITGKFTLDDSAGSTLYDWTLSVITGRVYATRNSTLVTWSAVNCSNITQLGAEDIYMNHSNPDDNITKTFNASFDAATNATLSGPHPAFWVGSRYIYSNKCPVVHTYVSSASQVSEFHEMALYDGFTVFYSAILEPDQTGFDSGTYDFQMIVPENGLPSFSGATAYYLYAEIGT